jgi:hypothetical protein
MTAALGREFLPGMVRMNLTVVSFGRTQKSAGGTQRVARRSPFRKASLFRKDQIFFAPLLAQSLLSIFSL